MISPTYISSYLVAEPRASRWSTWQPRLAHTWRWTCRRGRLMAALIRQPHSPQRIVAALATWGLILGTGMVSAVPHTMPGEQSLAQSVTAASAPAAVQAATKLSELPTGPTGMLLPPGSMAAPYTYSNSYSRGQCTWYVAGRRPIPAGWGNARSWLYHAKAAGWSTGSTPAVAAIAWTSAGYYGHVALVEAIEGNQVLIAEMNYLGPYRIDHRWVPASGFSYIY